VTQDKKYKDKNDKKQKSAAVKKRAKIMRFKESHFTLETKQITPRGSIRSKTPMIPFATMKQPQT